MIFCVDNRAEIVPSFTSTGGNVQSGGSRDIYFGQVDQSYNKVQIGDHAHIGHIGGAHRINSELKEILLLQYFVFCLF